MTTLPDLPRDLELGAIHIFECGPRTIAEFVREVADEADCWQLVLTKLERYRRVPPALVHAVGGGTFPRHIPREIPTDLGDAA